MVTAWRQSTKTGIAENRIRVGVNLLDSSRKCNFIIWEINSWIQILISNDSFENDNEVIEFTKIEIYDKDGRISNRIEAENMQNKIKISTLNLKNGLYYLRVFDSNGNVSSKQIIINH